MNAETSRLLVYPLNGGKNKITIYKDDHERLNDDEFLNDTIIEFYLMYLNFMMFAENRYILDHLPEETRQKTHFFNTFFWTNLTKKNAAG